MKTVVCLVASLLFVRPVSWAQEIRPFKAKNAVYAELLGTSVLYSLNYERLIVQKKAHAYGFRLGASELGGSPFRRSLVGELFVLTGTGRHHGDFGLAVSAMRGRSSSAESFQGELQLGLFAVPRLSYRYQKPTGGILLRAGFTPLVRLSASQGGRLIHPWGGVAVGYSF